MDYTAYVNLRGKKHTSNQLTEKIYGQNPFL